jgi:hypothetical protein
MEVFYESFINQPQSWVGIVIACLLSVMPFAIMCFVFAKNRDEKPSYIIEFDRMKDLNNAWTLLLVLVGPLVFIYNVFVWSAYAFVVFADFISSLIKKIYDYLITPILKAIMWLLNALLWIFLNVFWIPIKMIAKSVYYYCILWVWDLYKTSFLALNGTYNKSKLRVAFVGAFYALSIVGISVYLSLLFGLVVIGMVGVVVACLPIIKSFGILTSILHNSDGADHHNYGAKVMKTALNYVIAALVSVVGIEVLLYLSIIPDFGLVLLGIAINTNVILSSVLILSLIVLFFAKAIIPNHLLNNDESTSFKGSIVNYLYAIRDKGLQIVLGLIPGSMWSIVVLAIPVLFIYTAISTADSFKKSVFENRTVTINEDLTDAHLKALDIGDDLVKAEDAFKTAIELSVRSNQNSFGQDFPENVFDNPEIIFSSNSTSYTSTLPIMITAAIADTVSLAENIKNAEDKITTLNAEIKEYKSQKWEYIVQRRNVKNDKDSWITISSGTDISRFVDKDVKEGESYVYRVKAKNSKGASKWSTEVNDRIGNESLRAPSYLVAKSNLNFEVVLQWVDNSNNEDGFVVERKLSDKNKWRVLENIDSDVRSFTDNTIVTGKTYNYRVYAIGLGEESSPTNIATKSITLRSPYVKNPQANLKSVLVDWVYSAWNYKKATFFTDNQTDNATVGAYINSKKSFVDLLQDKISVQEDVIESNQVNLDVLREKIQMFASLIEYDESQRTTLKVFKNIAFLLALLFVSLFGGLILSVVITYTSSLFYNVYKINDNKPWYFLKLINEENDKDKNQPLLGFTLFILVVILLSGGLVVISDFM